MRRIATRQVGVRIGIAEIVERDHVELIGAPELMDRPHDVAPDTAVAIDSNLNCHV